jgi:uncharacterized protein YndB with AHSA1/START domain
MAARFSAQASIGIEAPIERVWNALVSPETVARYLHGTTMDADWRPGGAVRWSGEWEGQRYVDRGTVLRYEPPKAVSMTHWSPLSGTADAPENRHHVSYELAEQHGVTTLTIIHGNSPTQADADSMVENAWKPVLADIKRVVEEDRPRGGQ